MFASVLLLGLIEGETKQNKNNYLTLTHCSLVVSTRSSSSSYLSTSIAINIFMLTISFHFTCFSCHSFIIFIWVYPFSFHISFIFLFYMINNSFKLKRFCCKQFQFHFQFYFITLQIKRDLTNIRKKGL